MLSHNLLQVQDEPLPQDCKGGNGSQGWLLWQRQAQVQVCVFGGGGLSMSFLLLGPSRDRSRLSSVLGHLSPGGVLLVLHQGRSAATCAMTLAWKLCNLYDLLGPSSTPARRCWAQGGRGAGGVDTVRLYRNSQHQTRVAVLGRVTLRALRWLD